MMRDGKKLKEEAENITKELKRLFPTSKTVLSYSSPWELTVAVILSARNTDKKVNEVTKKLFKKYRGIEDFKNADLRDLEKDLSQLGLFRQKANFLKKSSEIIMDKYDGKIPKTMAQLISLPGIGRKTANIILGNVYGIVEGIAVDTHVTRLSRLFGLTNEKTPEKIEKDLMEILPQEEWFDFTNRMIDYGRLYCPAHCKHNQCPLRKYIGV